VILLLLSQASGTELSFGGRTRSVIFICGNVSFKDDCLNFFHGVKSPFVSFYRHVLYYFLTMTTSFNTSFTLSCKQEKTPKFAFLAKG